MKSPNSDRTTALAIQLKDTLKTDSTALAIRCQHVGITSSNIDEVIDMVQEYNSSVSSIVSLMEDGLTLNRVQQCLDISRSMPNFTIRLVNRYLEELNLQITDPAEIMSVFEEVCHHLEATYKTKRKHYPAHQIWHAIDEVFEGDIHQAYQLAVEDMDQFVRTISTKAKVHDYGDE